MPFFDGAQGRIFYRHWPTNTPPDAALVFLHGFGEHSGLYHRLAGELAGNGVELWALDHQGHGLSDGDRGDVGSYESVVANARTLTSIVESESPGLPVAIAGHSLGSLAAIFAALESPARYRVAVISGAPLSPLPWLDEVANDDRGESFSLDLDALSADPFYRDELANDPLAFTEADVAATLAALFGPAWERLHHALPSLRLPVLAVHGADDAIAPVDGVTRWQSQLADLRVEVIADAAHDVLNEVAHAQVANLVGEHIREHVLAGVRR